jgi:ATP-dependent RNA circularization protein (DNA/RNA ligase family)
MEGHFSEAIRYVFVCFGSPSSRFLDHLSERMTTYNTRNSMSTGMLLALQTAGYRCPLAWLSCTAKQAKKALNQRRMILRHVPRVLTL